MSEVTGTLITKQGEAAIAAHVAKTAELVINAVGFGDAAGLPQDPNENMTMLVRERYRAGVAGIALTENILWVDAVLPADAPDAQGRLPGGWKVAEAGLFGLSGATPLMIGAARMGNGYKPEPGGKQSQSTSYRLGLAVTNEATITVVIDPQAQLALGREVRPQWLTVDGVVNAPPAAPVKGATYIVGAAPTGAWAGFAGRLAQWIGVWSLASAPAGHVVADNSKAEGDPARYLKFIGGAWISAAASDVAYGVTRVATTAEARAGASRGLAICPADLAALTYLKLPAQDYYVDAANGSDVNDGSAAHPFKTIAAAQAAVIAGGLSFSQVSLHVAAGVYGGVTFGASPVSSWRLALAAGAIIDATSLAVNRGRGVIVNAGATVEVSGGQIKAAYEALAAPGGALTAHDLSIVMSTMPACATVAGYNSGSVMIYGSISVSGSGATLCAAADRSVFRLGFADATRSDPLALAFAAGVAFETGVLATGGYVVVYPAVVTYTGAPTGRRYVANACGVINSAGGGPNFLPGSLAGLTESGGYYV